MSPESSLNLQGGRFQKGRSGNPKGKPKGVRNKTTLIAQALLEGQAEALVTKVVQLALAGDLSCLRVCIERLVPPKRDTPIDIVFPDIKVAADAPKLLSIVMKRLREGGITPSEANALTDLVMAMQKLLELVDLDRRINALEEKFGSRRK